MAQTAFVNAELNDLFRAVTFARPATWFFGLDVSTSGSTYTEPTYVGYARVGLTRASGNWTAASGGQISNAVQISWPVVPTGYAGTDVIRRVFIANTSTPASEVLFDYVTLSPSIALVAGATPVLAIGAVVIQA